jgi:hypothetical protein
MAAHKLRAQQNAARSAYIAKQAAQAAKTIREELGRNNDVLFKAMQWHNGNANTDTPRLDEGWTCGKCRQHNVELALVCLVVGCGANPKTGKATYDAPEGGVYIPPSTDYD